MEGKGMRELGEEDQLWEPHLPLGLRAAPGVISGPREGGHQGSRHDRSCREHVPGGGGRGGGPRETWRPDWTGQAEAPRTRP